MVRAWLRSSAESCEAAGLLYGSRLHALRGQLNAIEDNAPSERGTERLPMSRLRALWREGGLELLERAELELREELSLYDQGQRAHGDAMSQAIRAAAEAGRLPGPGPDRELWLEQVWYALIACPASRVNALRVAASLDGTERRALLDLVFREAFGV